MIVVVLSTDKITQNIFKSGLKNLTSFSVIGTHSNQDISTFQERLSFIKKQSKNVIVFHALKHSRFALDKEWEPAPGIDFQKELFNVADTVVYTPSLRQSSFGKTVSVLKGDISVLEQS